MYGYGLGDEQDQELDIRCKRVQEGRVLLVGGEGCHGFVRTALWSAVFRLVSLTRHMRWMYGTVHTYIIHRECFFTLTSLWKVYAARIHIVTCCAAALHIYYGLPSLLGISTPRPLHPTTFLNENWNSVGAKCTLACGAFLH